MIPEFPKFKNLELSDREEVERFTSKFLPYSDFNFVSMYAWDVKGEMRISKLNDNLVVRFTDYLSGTPFFSFLGENKVHETAKTLIEFSKQEHAESALYLVPENLQEHIDPAHAFSLEQDPDAYDYIYEVAHLANMHNWSQHTSGKHVRAAKNNLPDYKVLHNSIKELDKELYLELFKRWAISRGIDSFSYMNELNAFSRIFEEDLAHLKVVSMFIGDNLAGFTVYEVISKDYAISHFAKTDKTYHKSVTDVLNWEEANILHRQGIKYFNWEQDLGIPGIRKSKEKYNPVFLLKKITLSLKSD